MNKLGFTEKQVGHMTLKKFELLYSAYKQEYDKEFIMRCKYLTYKDLETPTSIDDVIPI